MLQKRSKFCIKSTVANNYERKAYNFIVNRLSNSIAGKMACEQSGTAVLKFLKDHYSTGNAFELKTNYENFKMMAHHNDAIKYIDTINGLKPKAIQANAKINPRDEFKKLVNVFIFLKHLPQKLPYRPTSMTGTRNLIIFTRPHFID